MIRHFSSGSLLYAIPWCEPVRSARAMSGIREFSNDFLPSAGVGPPYQLHHVLTAPNEVVEIKAKLVPYIIDYISDHLRPKPTGIG